MTDAQRTAIEKHGRKLLVIFPNATEQDPVKLCKRLRALEVRANAFAMRLCNGPEYGSPEAADKIGSAILGKVNTLLGNYVYNDRKKVRTLAVPVFLNRDPRGYALKIRDEHAHNLDISKDWGGYGIIAPEINEEGN